MASVYEMISDRFIEELKKGIIPWQKPWTGVREGAYSRSTGRPYSLINQLLLGKPGEYLTFKQVQEAGGKIKKGEKSSFVVFWKPLPVKETTKDGREVTKVIPFLKYYNVFHISQCENIEPKYKEAQMHDFDPVEEAERVLEEYALREHISIINEKGNRAYYSPMLDEIHLPLREQFMKVAEYYSTAFHEATHSTGHESRLNRLSKDAHFGNEEYSKEELVAEIGAAVLCNEMNLETADSFKNSAAYVQNWLSVLQNDSRMIVSAAGKAEKAVKLILNIKEDKKDAGACAED